MNDKTKQFRVSDGNSVEKFDDIGDFAEIYSGSRNPQNIVISKYCDLGEKGGVYIAVNTDTFLKRAKLRMDEKVKAEERLRSL